jgi:Ca-activated chloride channel homolog
MLSRCALLLVAVFVVPVAHGQDRRPPALVFETDGKLQPLAIRSVQIRARIIGRVAETSMTLVFSNPNARALAGDLYFPLPEGATVSGYALDVNGALVDGVAIPKDRGRQVFEKEVRKGVDPGLVEWAKGNVFKTRVFPIPPKGTRTVRVSYVTDLVEDADGADYFLPLAFRDPVAEFSLAVEAVKPSGEPSVSPGAVANFAFAKWEDGFRAETAMKDVKLDKDLRISLPATDKPDVAVEVSEDGEAYFQIVDQPAIPGNAAPPVKMEKIAIFWDASASRGKTDHAREISLLKAWLGLFADETIAIDLVPFRNVAEQPKQFAIRNGDATELTQAIAALPYDGGTQIGALRAPEKARAILLFTDGLSNVGQEDPDLSAPTYVFSADQQASHAFLRYLALKTGGAYFNLNTVRDDAVLAAMGAQPFSFLGAAVDGG